MWISSKFGFFSVVAKKADEIHIRARVRGDLENVSRECFGGVAKVHDSKNADYCCRIVLTGEHASAKLTQFMLWLGGTIDYSNFKSMISASKDQHHKCSAYGKMWGTMMDVQNEQQRGKPKKGERQYDAFDSRYYTRSTRRSQEPELHMGDVVDDRLEHIQQEHDERAMDNDGEHCESCGRVQFADQTTRCWYCGIIKGRA